MSVGDYGDAAAGWASGAARVYGPLAVELVGCSPHPLAGRRVLDAGAGAALPSPVPAPASSTRRPASGCGLQPTSSTASGP